MSKSREDLTSKVFGRLTVIEFSGDGWLCLCSCGKTTVVRACNLKTNTRSCGCLKREMLLSNNVTHGRTNTPEYRAWFATVQRCTNPKHPYWPRYGGRGISVWPRWRKFENFFADMGLKPSPSHSLDRVDVNSGYCLANCRWATPKQQASNTSLSIQLSHNGKTQVASAWSEELGIPRSTIYSRIRRGWSPDAVLFK